MRNVATKVCKLELFSQLYAPIKTGVTRNVPSARQGGQIFASQNSQMQVKEDRSLRLKIPALDGIWEESSNGKGTYTTHNRRADRGHAVVQKVVLADKRMETRSSLH